MIERIRELMADVFRISLDEIDDDISPENLDKWDSIAHINLIAALEEEFDVSFEVEEIENMNGLGDVVEVVEAKLER